MRQLVSAGTRRVGQRALVGCAPLGQVTDETGEHHLARQSNFADGKLHRKRRSVLPLADDDATDTDDSEMLDEVFDENPDVMDMDNEDDVMETENEDKVSGIEGL